MLIATLARKDLRLLLRDRRAIIILILMPLVFILVLGLSLGEGFGQKPDDRLRVSLVDLDEGFVGIPAIRVGGDKPEPWSVLVQRDLAQTAGIRVELIPSVVEAERLVRESKRAAVLVFGPEFTRKVTRCSFLADGINPFYRDGVNLAELDAKLLTDATQLTASSIIDQVAQVTLLRVILPWMIGRAFEKLGDPSFMSLLASEVPGAALLPAAVKRQLGSGIQGALKRLFPKYNLTGKTWAALTKSEPRSGEGAGVSVYQEEGSGVLKRGALRYQLLVPSYTVMFAFFLVLTVGWLFVAERRQGTLLRLKAAPLTRLDLLLGKLMPCFALSIFQGLFLLVAGKVVFGMSWGTHPVWLLAVVFSTSLAAMGLALLVAAAAKTETQVAIYGTLLVLVLAGMSGCLMGDRALMPETMQQLSLFTPHAWALTAYKQLLTAPKPNLDLVAQACMVLGAFGAGLLTLAWYVLKLD
jgi:ABC-type multidrug transport system permease subunit